MNFKEILELIDRVAERSISSIEIEQAGTRVRVEGRQQVSAAAPAHPSGHSSDASPPPAHVSPSAASVTPPPQEAKRAEEDADAGLHVITSPIVGTFYRSANPESAPFVSEGDRIAKGKVLCIIEAMKLMNEIESDVEGTIVRIYPQNGQPIEYGEKLFAVKR